MNIKNKKKRNLKKEQIYKKLKNNNSNNNKLNLFLLQELLKILNKNKKKMK